jgi:ADP-ribose pyrophosphatase
MHAVAQADYITILAITPSGKIPIVRQFRRAVEQYTWELPAGLLEPGEIPLETCRRELKEETGLGVLSIKPLGSYFGFLAISSGKGGLDGCRDGRR